MHPVEPEPDVAPYGKVLGTEAQQVHVPHSFYDKGHASAFRAPGFLITPLDTPEERAKYLERAREAQERIFSAKAAGATSRVPLGKNGVQVVQRFSTAYKDMTHYGGGDMRRMECHTDVKK